MEKKSCERKGRFFVLVNLQVEDETQDREQEDEQRPYPFQKEQVKTKTREWIVSGVKRCVCTCCKQYKHKSSRIKVRRMSILQRSLLVTFLLELRTSKMAMRSRMRMI